MQYQDKMKTRTALIAAGVLGLLAYSIPLDAANAHEYHLEEKTVIDIPIVGRITTLTSSYLAGCKLKETTRIKMHNPLIKTLSDSDGKIEEVQLSDLCEEIQWTYDQDSAAYVSHSFGELRQIQSERLGEEDVKIDIQSDQNDIEDLPRMEHQILAGKKNINGFQSREVMTKVLTEDNEHNIIIHEFYTGKAKALNRISKAREDLFEKLGYDEDHAEGVPDLIKLVYNAMRRDQEWERPDGEVVRFIIEMMDEDDDPVFSMQYDITVAEKIKYQADHFVLK